ncbi:suppressor of Mek1-like isoform X2 [Bradysia coprophila]|uniref:suppressor of Mek1-like isoform X2 n=1 Tax=Bradysia coprophila TaxID=38358 RepID=UPI00187D9FE2|nr:suppressor of Mek1-like isoform X2 [Bradysia coprophila]
MDKKPNKLNSVTTIRFNEISEKIKESIALLTQLSVPFQFAQPAKVSSPISNLNVLGISNFAFSEPLIEMSSLAIQDSEFESSIKLEDPLENSDDDNGRSDDSDTVPWMFLIKTEDELVSNDGNENSSVRSDDIVVKLEKSLEIFDEIVSNDDNEHIASVSLPLENNEESTVPWNCAIKISDVAISSDRSDYKEQYDDNDVTSDDGGNSPTLSLQEKCYEESDEKFELDSNDQALSVRLNGLAEYSSDDKGVGNNEACNIHSEDQEHSRLIDCNEIQVQDVQMECNEEQNVDNVMASNNSRENIQISSVTLNCSVQQSDNEKVLLKDVNENIPVPNISIAYSSTQDVDNVSPNDNSPTNACITGNIDRNAQMKHFEVDSRNVTLNCPVEQNVDGDVNENIPNIQTAFSKCQDVHNVTPTDNSDNDQTVACRSGYIDPNTQITSLEVDSHTRPAQKLHDNQPLPFLIQHIHKITWANQEEVAFAPVMQLFGQTFNTVMIYGVVTSLTVEQGGLTLRFVIDDGSGSINVVWKASNQILELLKTIHHLDEEVKLCRKAGLSVMNENWQPNSDECKKMLDSFDTTIHYIKRQITERTKLKLFGYAGVVGKPFRSRNIVQLLATHIEDNSRDRSLELYFKKNLIRLYREKYMPNG